MSEILGYVFITIINIKAAQWELFSCELKSGQLIIRK